MVSWKFFRIVAQIKCHTDVVSLDRLYTKGCEEMNLYTVGGGVQQLDLKIIENETRASPQWPRFTRITGLTTETFSKQRKFLSSLSANVPSIQLTCLTVTINLHTRHSILRKLSRHCLILERLEVTFSDPGQVDALIQHIVLPAIRTLSSITIKVLSEHHVGPKDILPLVQALKRSKCLVEFILELETHALWKDLKDIPSLQRVSVSEDDTHRFYDEEQLAGHLANKSAAVDYGDIAVIPHGNSIVKMLAKADYEEVNVFFSTNLTMADNDTFTVHPVCKNLLMYDHSTIHFPSIYGRLLLDLRVNTTVESVFLYLGLNHAKTPAQDQLPLIGQMIKSNQSIRELEIHHPIESADYSSLFDAIANHNQTLYSLHIRGIYGVHDIDNLGALEKSLSSNTTLCDILMGDREKAKEFIDKAERCLSGGNAIMSFFFGGDAARYDDAASDFSKAANLYKMAKMWDEAGNAFKRSADCYLKAGKDNGHDATMSYVSAIACYKKGNVSEAFTCLKAVVQYYTDEGQFSTAARYHKEAAEMYEAEADFDKAIGSYQVAADYYEGENQAVSAHQCLIKIAVFSAQLEHYEKAIEIYNRCASASLDNNLTQLRSKEYILSACLCYLASDDSVSAERALQRYSNMLQSFSSSKEYSFISDVIQAIRDNNVDNFSNTVADYNSTNPLDTWRTTMLLRIKKTIANDTESVI
eukprot:gene14257-16827_t